MQERHDQAAAPKQAGERKAARSADADPGRAASAGQSAELMIMRAAAGFGGGGLGGGGLGGGGLGGGLGGFGTPGAELTQGGHGLDAGLRGELEQATGSDLGGVRVHTDGQAAAAAQQYDARAFAVGQHIHFGAGNYDPGSSAGRHLIAHEVAHTVQQQGASQVQASALSVSSPTDSFEVEAETFATQFATGGPTVGLTPIRRGGVARALVQRQHGPPTVEEMAAALSKQIVQARMGGTAAVVAKVKQMRANADTGDARKAVEKAIADTLTQAEQDALAGKKPAGDPPKGTANDGDTPKTDPPATGTGTGDKGKGKGKGKNGSGDLTQGDGEPDTDTPDRKDDKTGDKGDKKGKGKADDPPGGKSTTPTGGKGKMPPVSDAKALEAIKPVDANRRALVQQELAFHENWKALSGDSKQRAAHLLDTLGNDAAQGLKGGAYQVVGGLVGEGLAKLPVPGLANIFGGAMSGVWLFQGGGASAVTDLQEGVAAIFKEGIGPFQRTADIIQALKSMMDLVGNVCNVLSGLAYAFAAIAALGGLLSFLCPALAFLVPHIPGLINFGRMTGGIAQVAIAISNLISPLPAAFRALHIITSNDDPIKLVAQEQQYHAELQGAIANYSSAAVAGARDGYTKGRESGLKGKALAGATLKGGRNPLKPMWGGLKSGVASTKDAYSDMRSGNAQTKEALGMTGKTKQEIRDDGQKYGKEHFSKEQLARLDGRSQEQEAAKQKALNEKQGEINEIKTKIAQREGLISQAKGGKKGGKKAGPAHHKKKLIKLQERLEVLEGQMADLKAQHSSRENYVAGLRSRWGGRGKYGDVQGEAGAALDGARGASGGGEQGGDGDGKVKVEKDAKGNVKLPEPPSSLKDIDAYDGRITTLQKNLKTQQSNTKDVKTFEQKAKGDAGRLGDMNKALGDRKSEVDARGKIHEKVNADNADAKAKTAQTDQGADQGINKAAKALQPIAGPLRTVNGVVQKVPSNRFFNVSGTQKNLCEMTQAVNEITGTGDQKKAAIDSAKTTLQSREDKAKEAGTARDANTTAVTDFQGQVKADKEKTDQAAANAAQKGKQSQQQELTLAQQIEQAKQEKAHKWGALVNWANQHYAIRQTVK